MTELRVVQYGLGPIGCECVRQLMTRPGVRLVGAVDIDPGKAGRDVAEVAGLPEPLGIRVRDDAPALLAETRPNVVIHSTASSLPAVAGQLTDILSAGAHVITTCEEAAFPRWRHPEVHARLDELARRQKVTLLGTGINPGFIMDTLALTLSAPCMRLERVQVHRVVDAAARRLPLQRKIGAGLTLEEFEAERSVGRVGHVGLAESAALIAYGLGWRLDRIEETLEPIAASENDETPYLSVPAGSVAGIHQVVLGWEGDALRVVLMLDMAVHAPEPGDHILLDMGAGGRIEAHIAGIHGDTATAAVVINAIPQVLRAPAGFLTMADMPLVRYWGRPAW